MLQADEKAAADAKAKAERRARVRRQLVGGQVDPAPIIKPPSREPVFRTTAAAFEEFCAAAVNLGAHPQDMIDIWRAELASLGSDDERHVHRLALLERNLRGCRVRIVRCTEHLNGCEGLVLSTKRAVGSGRSYT